MDEKIIQDKMLLLGKHVIVNDGDFKGVSGLMKNVDIETDTVNIKNSKNEIVMTLYEKNKINCNIIVNEDNTIVVPLNCLSKFE